MEQTAKTSNRFADAWRAFMSRSAAATARSRARREKGLALRAAGMDERDVDRALKHLFGAGASL